MAGLDEPVEDLLAESGSGSTPRSTPPSTRRRACSACSTACTSRGLPLAVATSSRRAYAERLLAAARTARAVLVHPGAEDVTRGKPDPEIYATAVQRFGVPATTVLVLEDSPAGVEAGVQAGTVVAAIPHEHSPETGLHAAHLVVPRLDDAADLRLFEPRITDVGRASS